MKSIKNFQTNISAKEQKSIAGGLTTEEILNLMWNLTPDGCNSHWINSIHYDSLDFAHFQAVNAWGTGIPFQFCDLEKTRIYY